MTTRSQTLASLLTNPFVLRAAWAKTRAWYATVEWPPEPSWTEWCADPWPRLVAIADELVAGTFAPQPMPQVPYPKQYGDVRHYVIPAIEDQVAHMIYAVLLAPFIEARLANVNFGSRWYRALKRHHPDEGGPRWVRKPHSLSDLRLYAPYNRDYGLFRRLASWIAEDFTGGRFRSTAPSDREITREEYPSQLLPFTNRLAFRLAHSPQVAYARLDLRKAYPSFHRKTVRRHLLQLLADDLPGDAPRSPALWDIAPDLGAGSVDLPEAAPSIRGGSLGHPWQRLSGPRGEPLRLALARQWMDLLDRATYVSEDTDFDLRDVVPRPFSPGQRRYDDSFGLPTGLAVSPMLMNVALCPFDYAMIRHLEPADDERSFDGAYLRFADDIIVFGRDGAALQAMLGEMRRVLGGYERYGPGLHPQINWAKARPEAIRKWGIAKTWDRPPDLADADMIDRDSPGEFVTYLVEHMSGLGVEHISERRGAPARARLSRLHELARWDIADVEVRKDTRLSFVANKLARAWVPRPGARPDDSIPGAVDRWLQDLRTYHHDIEDVRRSIRRAILETPFKFHLWRSAIQAALRPSLSEGDGGVLTPSLDGGLEWLRGLLGLLAVGGTWEREWPLCDHPQTSVSSELAAWQARDTIGFFRRARVSFIRAHFWRELATLIRQLDAASTVSRDIDPPPASWYARAWGPHPLTDVVARLRATDDLGITLYSFQELSLPAWERDAISLVLAAAADVAGTSTPPPGNNRLLSLVGLGSDAAVAEHVLRPFRQLVLQPSWPIEATVHALVRRADRASDSEVAKAIDDGITELADGWPGAHARRKARPHDFYMLLEFYSSLRRLVLAAGAGPDVLERLSAAVGGRNTRHLAPPLPPPSIAHLVRAVWSRGAQGVPLSRWHIEPTRVPAVGLPSPWALKLFHDLLATSPPRSTHLVPEAVVRGSWSRTFEEHRLRRLGNSYMQAPSSLPSSSETKVATWTDHWSIPPHPASFIPAWMGWDATRSHRWHAALALFLALDGDERFHDASWRTFPTSPCWNEHLERRCATPLPSYVWNLVDAAMGSGPTSTFATDLSLLAFAASGTNLMSRGGEEYITTLKIRQAFPLTDPSEYLDPVVQRPTPLTTGPFGWEDFSTVPEPWEVRRPWIKVRVAQVAANPPWTAVPGAWPVPRSICAEPLEQAKLAIAHEGADAPGGPPQLIILPELALHADDAIDVARQAARDLGAGVLSGLFWREVEAPIKPLRGVPPDVTRYFANEAILAIPNFKEPHRAAPYIFRIRKPRPAHIEYGVEKVLTDGVTDGVTPVHPWQLLPGDEWTLFDHPQWGPFAVGICSDLLDVKPWTRFKGRILHLFLVAWNTDTKLYDAMTWVRAYELYTNVVLVNHGDVGGSLAWTPRHSQDRNLFSAYGKGHFVITDVQLPVKEIYEAQRTSKETKLAKVTKAAKKMFRGEHDPPGAFYALPPDYHPHL